MVIASAQRASAADRLAIEPLSPRPMLDTEAIFAVARRPAKLVLPDQHLAWRSVLLRSLAKPQALYRCLTLALRSILAPTTIDPAKKTNTATLTRSGSFGST